MLHEESTNNHRLENWVYADSTARGAATGFVAADIGKVAFQSSDHTYWRLTAITPTWVAIGSASGPTLPTGGTIHQALRKNSSTDGDASWADVKEVPPAGTIHQVLTKQSSADDDADWETPSSGLPTGGTSGQVLTKASSSDGDANWQTPSGGSGGWTQQINESGASLSNWTVLSGSSWSSNGTEILQTDTASSNHILYYTTKIGGGDWALEAQVFVATAGSDPQFQFGFFDGTTWTNVIVMTLRKSTSGGGQRVTLDAQGTTIYITTGNNVLSYDAYHTIRIRCVDRYYAVWVDSVLVLSGWATPGVVGGYFFGINSVNSSMKVKNIKLYTPKLPWE